MTTTPPRRSGAQVLIDQLRIHGTDTIFGVPGESYLAALDALYAQRKRSATSSAARKAARPTWPTPTAS